MAAIRQVVSAISIHALLAESDGQSSGAGISEQVISIHALLAESDEKYNAKQKRADHFYPRSPCGERRPDPSEG